jgi:hypothetical protein
MYRLKQLVPVYSHLLRNSFIPSFMSRVQTKYIAIKSPCESRLRQLNPDISLEVLEDFWGHALEIFEEYISGPVYFLTFATIMLKIQGLIGMISLYFDDDDYYHFDDVAILLYSASPKHLHLKLGTEVANLIDSLVYVHRKGAKVEEYQKYLGWIDREQIDFDSLYTQFPLKKDIKDIFLKNYTSRITQESLTDRIDIGDLISEDHFQFDNTEMFQESFFVRYQARFLSFLLATRPITFQWVVALIEGMRASTSFFCSSIKSKNGASKFAAVYLEGFLQRKEYYPEDLLRMMRNTAYVIAETPLGFDPIQHILSLARWFDPWMDMNLLDKSTVMIIRPTFMTGLGFLKWFNEEHLRMRNEWDLEGMGKPLKTQQIEIFKNTVAHQFEKTEMDLALINVLFYQNSKRLLESDALQILLFCLQNKMGTMYKIRMPEIPVPNDWVKERYDPKFFTGGNPADYPKWRQEAFSQLLKNQENDAFQTVLNLLKNPIAAEIEIALDLSAKKNKKKAPKVSCQLMDIFNYLDAAYKFTPDQDWVESELFRNIGVVIEGIRDAGEKEKATLASTWKCEKFEEYMRIVSLL